MNQCVVNIQWLINFLNTLSACVRAKARKAAEDHKDNTKVVQTNDKVNLVGEIMDIVTHDIVYSMVRLYYTTQTV